METESTEIVETPNYDLCIKEAATRAIVGGIITVVIVQVGPYLFKKGAAKVRQIKADRALAHAIVEQ